MREQRLAAGLTQRDLAQRSGLPQPNISAYERGRRQPSPETYAALERALRIPTMRRVRAHRDAVLEEAARRNLSDVRVFGSVAREEAGEGSDVDILVRPGPNASIFDLAGFMEIARGILGVPVDVVSDQGVGPAMDRIREEAIPL